MDDGGKRDHRNSWIKKEVQGRNILGLIGGRRGKREDSFIKYDMSRNYNSMRSKIQTSITFVGARITEKSASGRA